MSELPKELRPVLAVIEEMGDLAKYSWREVVYYDDTEKKWCGYAGGTSFENGERVVRWVYAAEVLP